MDVTKAFTYVFDDDKWVSKIGIGVLVTIASIFIIPALLVGGWLIATTRNVIAGKEHPLADWDDWGQLFRDGGALILATLVYSSPFILIFCIGFFATIGFGGLSEAINEDVAAGGLIATWGVLACLGIIMGIAMFFIGPAITLQYVRTNDLGACFRFGEVLGIIQNNFGDIFIVALVPFIINLVVGLASLIPCLGFILGLVAAPYVYAVLGHLYGQLALKIDGAGKGPKFDSVMP